MSNHLLAAAVLAVGTVALRGPDGQRIHVAHGQPLPDWTPDATRAELLRLGAARPSQPAASGAQIETGRFDLRTASDEVNAETQAELDRATAEAVAGPGESVDEILAAANAEAAKADAAAEAQPKAKPPKKTPAKPKT